MKYLAQWYLVVFLGAVTVASVLQLALLILGER
jgi:hypothetical protein